MRFLSHSLRRASVRAVLALTLVACSGDGTGPAGGEEEGPPDELGPPAAITVASGDGQEVSAGEQAAAPLVVRVTDDDDHPLDGVAVSWSVGSGGGSLSETTTTTDAQGETSVTYVAGTQVGAASVRAAVGSLVVDFQVTVVSVLPQPGTFLVNISAAGDHSCGLGEQGLVFCWGGGHSFALGDGFLAGSPYPVPVLGDQIFQAVTSGAGHACALTFDGTAFCWGTNWGANSSEPQYHPQQVQGEVSFRMLAAGWAHTCGIDLVDQAHCWGSNAYGEFGDGHSGTRSETPQPVSGDHGFATLSAGSATCGVTLDGIGLCWGNNDAGQLGNGQNEPSEVPDTVSGNISWATISVGDYHACGLDREGRAYCWGANESGQLGDGTTNASTIPVLVVGGLTFMSISAGFYSTCGVSTDRGLYCWGGRQGTNNVYDYEPSLVQAGAAAMAVSVGPHHSCLITVDGAALCWGDNDFSKLGSRGGQDTQVPVPVLGGIRFATSEIDREFMIPRFEAVELGLGLWHSCAVARDGQVYCWGDGDFGNLGTGFGRNSAVPLATALSASMVMADGGEIFSCGLTASGDAFCWGDGRYGRLGNGSTTGSNLPVRVDSNLQFEIISTGARHACALTADGAAYCWGNNSMGQLGIGTTGGPEHCTGFVCSSVPVAVVGNLKFRTLSVGAYHNCGVADDGVAYCWGHNFHGELGIEIDNGPENCESFGSSTPAYCSTGPVPVAGSLSFSSVTAAYGTHTCGVAESGAGYCWGSNEGGQLGDGTTVDRTAPTQVAGDLSWSSIAGTCGLTTAGAAYCWGGGGLGNAAIDESLVPVPVTTSERFQLLDVGGGHSCAISSVGVVYCWGLNILGQVGNGVTPLGEPRDVLPMPVWGAALPDLR